MKGTDKIKHRKASDFYFSPAFGKAIKGECKRGTRTTTAKYRNAYKILTIYSPEL
jgi:hypothetical protein